MLPTTKHSAPKYHPEGRSGPNHSLLEMDNSNRTQADRNDWADINGQVDYFVSAGLNNDSIYNAALTPGAASLAISPLRPSGRLANATKPAWQRTYPSQELNPRYGSLPLPSPKSEGSIKPPPLMPPLPPLPNTGSFPHDLFAEEVPSMETDTSIGQLPQGIARKFHPDEVTSMATGLTQDFNDLSAQKKSGETTSNETMDTELDSFELSGVDTEPTGTYLDVEPDELKPNRVSTSPEPKAKPTRSRAKKARKKSKGKPKKTQPAAEIAAPTDIDILKGRGGMTNRHPGNIKFRDEARKMRASYRDDGTTRQEKFLLSKQLLKKVKGYGGRFLEQGSDQLWHEMPEKACRKKCSQVLREVKWD